MPLPWYLGGGGQQNPAPIANWLANIMRNVFRPAGNAYAGPRGSSPVPQQYRRPAGQAPRPPVPAAPASPNYWGPSWMRGTLNSLGRGFGALGASFGQMPNTLLGRPPSAPTPQYRYGMNTPVQYRPYTSYGGPQPQPVPVPRVPAGVPSTFTPMAAGPRGAVEPIWSYGYPSAPMPGYSGAPGEQPPDYGGYYGGGYGGGGGYKQKRYPIAAGAPQAAQGMNLQGVAQQPRYANVQQQAYLPRWLQSLVNWQV